MGEACHHVITDLVSPSVLWLHYSLSKWRIHTYRPTSLLKGFGTEVTLLLTFDCQERAILPHSDNREPWIWPCGWRLKDMRRKLWLGHLDISATCSQTNTDYSCMSHPLSGTLKRHITSEDILKFPTMMTFQTTRISGSLSFLSYPPPTENYLHILWKPAKPQLIMHFLSLGS